ncbi:hypothetical protein V2J09_004037 [Rumex salicifolius]
MAPSLSKASSDDASSSVTAADPSLSISLDSSNFMVNGHVILSDVPSNITATPASPGLFVGFEATVPKDRHVIPVGRLLDTRFMRIFRFKVWWTTHWVGSNGRDLEHETQILLLDGSDTGRPYVLLLPILEGPFRASLQPGEDDYVDICVESGSTRVSGSVFRAVMYMLAGEDPFSLVKEAVKAVREHMGTFRLLEEKSPPAIVDRFGWCTWDAFYLKVHPQGVWEGVKGLVDGGCPPGLVLIDDGWQSICHDDDPISDQEGMNRTSAGEQMPCRLTKYEENYKFRDYRSSKDLSSGQVGPKTGLGAFVRDLKEEFESVDQVYVWHAFCGYWGGLRPDVPGLPEARVVRPKLSPGLEKTMEDLAVDKIVNNGVGLVPPELAHQMYEGLHSHLESVGIDGVKVDVIHLLEMLSEEYGGRVELAKAYFKALTDSVNKHFKGNAVIASMEHCNDFMFLGTQAIALDRVGDDFWCTDPSGDPNGTFWLQGCHMVHCAYNSLWMGNFIHPDWDMFQSTHPCAEFHAASRAVSGGPIYVSDTVGQHKFDLLKTMVLPDGTLLRCDYYALPTRDCLFEDPLHNGQTMLKIWNLNKFTGVVGVFNCQGGGWCKETRRNQCFSEFSKPVKCVESPKDIEWKNGNKQHLYENATKFAVYSYKSKNLIMLDPSQGVEITLDPFNFELLTVSPLISIPQKNKLVVEFAPIGLVNMLNTGGAIQSVEVDDEAGGVKVGVKGAGKFMAFASEKPKACKINGEDVEFEYLHLMVEVQVQWPGCSKTLSMLDYLF